MHALLAIPDESSIVSELEPMVRRVSRSAPPAERDDLRQQLRVAAVKAVRRWDGSGRRGPVEALAWAYLGNERRNQFAKRRTRERRRESGDPVWFGLSREESPPLVAERHDEVERLLRLADPLTRRLLRRILGGLTLTDAAAAEGVAFSTANQRMIMFRRLVAPPKPPTHLEQLHAESGTVVAVFKSPTAAARALGVNRREIVAACERGGTAQGWRWRRRVGGVR